MQSGKSAGDQFHHAGRYLAVGQIYKIRAQSGRNRLVKPLFINESAIDHRLSDALPVHRDLVQNVISLRRLQNVLLDEKLGDLFVVHVSDLAI
jgi:hypothetical protein